MVKKAKQNERLIHVRLSESMHKSLRVLVAELDTSIQNWVSELIVKELKKKGKIGG